MINKTKFHMLYGLTQSPDTNDYILVQNNIINWVSGNEKIDNFIQEMLLNIKYCDTIFEWISYSQFEEIEEIGKGGFATVYSAIWKDGPLNENNNYKRRDMNKVVALKCLNNSRNFTNELLNEV
jgi:hypothetical protein